MKRLVLFICFLIMFVPFNVNAASAIASMNGPINSEVGQNFSVRLSLYVSDYGNADAIYAINGTLQYDTTLLELVSVDSNLTLANNPLQSMPNFRFELTSNNGFKGGEFLVVTFKVRKVGEVNFELINSQARFGKGDNVETITLMAPSYKVNGRQGTSRASSNNNLKDLEIAGYDIKFDKNVTTYKLTMYENKPLLINPQVEDSLANFTISGNANFIVGDNEILITVTAEDGTKKTYTIIGNLVLDDDTLEDEKDTTVVAVPDVEDEGFFKKYDQIMIPIFVVTLIILVTVLIVKRPKKKRKYKKRH